MGRTKGLYIRILAEVSQIDTLLVLHHNVCIKESSVSSPCPTREFSPWSDTCLVLFSNTESTAPVNWTSLLSKDKINRYIIRDFFVYFMPSNQDTENICCCDNSFLKAIKKYFNCFNLISETTKCSTSHCLHKKRH